MIDFMYNCVHCVKKVTLVMVTSFLDFFLIFFVWEQ